MKSRFGLRYLVVNDWAWIFAKLSAGILMPLSIIDALGQTAAVRNGTVNATVLSALMYMMLFGGLLSISGILARGTRLRPLIVGYAIEIAGIIPLMVGPLLLSAIYLVSSINSGGTMTGFTLCLSLSALFIARFTDIYVHHLSSKKDHESAIARAQRLHKKRT
jgi:hypothetical protein